MFPKNTTWPIVSLKSITVKIGSGATPRGGKESYKQSGISLIRSLNVYDFSFDKNDLALIDEQQAEELRNVEVHNNDILLNITGASVARCCIVPSRLLPARVNQHVAIVRCDPSKAESKFILYVINSPYYKHNLLTLAQGGATREALTKQTIEDFGVPFPPLPIQRRIASILSAYDDLIENNTRRIAILEEMARRIYEEWFVHFRFPGHEKVKMVDSELGKIPEGWKVRPLRDILTICRGKSYKSSELVSEGGLPFINLKCINRDGGFRKDGLKRFNGPYKAIHTVKPGDLVVAVTDMTQERRIVARCGRVPRLDTEVGVVSMDLVKIVNKDIPRDYLYGILRWSGMPDAVKQYANGANVLHLLPERIEEYKFVSPNFVIAEQFNQIVNPMLNLCDVLEDKNANLRTTRDFLLPKLISGEIDVSQLPEPEEAAA